MPEEINRIVADEFSDHLFVHSDEAIENLHREGIPDERIHFVGNTMIDSLVAMEDRFRTHGDGAAPRVDARASTCSSPFTAPRWSTVHFFTKRWRSLRSLAHRLPVIFPMHPRTRKMLDGRGFDGRACCSSIQLAISSSCRSEADAAAVLTDSEGSRRRPLISVFRASRFVTTPSARSPCGWGRIPCSAWRPTGSPRSRN